MADSLTRERKPCQGQGEIISLQPEGQIKAQMGIGQKQNADYTHRSALINS